MNMFRVTFRDPQDEQAQLDAGVTKPISTFATTLSAARADARKNLRNKVGCYAEIHQLQHVLVETIRPLENE